MNPAALFKIKGLWDKFTANHPKFMPFIRAVGNKGVTEGTVIEIKVKYTDESEHVTNMKINQEDLALFEEIKKLQ